MLRNMKMNTKVSINCLSIDSFTEGRLSGMD